MNEQDRRAVVAALNRAGRHDLARIAGGVVGKFSHRDIETIQDALFVMDGVYLALNRLGMKQQAGQLKRVHQSVLKGMGEPVESSVVTAKLSVETRNYENSHGRKPKGSGMWIFALGDRPDDMSTWYRAHGNYLEALKQAKAAAKAKGVDTIHVMP